MSVTTSIVEGTNTFSDTVTFNLNFKDPCLTSAWNAASINNMVTSVLVNPTLAP